MGGPEEYVYGFSDFSSDDSVHSDDLNDSFDSFERNQYIWYDSDEYSEEF